MKILVVAPSWIGDAILAQPLLARLKEQRGASLDVLAGSWCAPLFARMEEVGRVIPSPFTHGELGLRARWRLGRLLRREGYAEAVILPNSWKSALVPFFAGIPVRTGFMGECRVGLINRRHALDEAALPKLAERYALLAEEPGASVKRPLAQPRLASSAEQQRAARRALGLPEAAEPVVFCPGAEYGPAKRWPTHHFAQLARELATPAAPAWLIGSPRDEPIGLAIEAAAGGAAKNLCGKTTLEQAIDLIAGARLVVANDSGLMHVAAACGRPLVALYGSSSPGYTPPLSSHAKIISLEMECSPCFKRACPLGHLNCLEQLTPQRVREAIAQ